jgi:hypothetical protein
MEGPRSKTELLNSREQPAGNLAHFDDLIRDDSTNRDHLDGEWVFHRVVTAELGPDCGESDDDRDCPPDPLRAL